MIKILFVCHGNICRSPMAEYLFRDMVKNEELSQKIICASAATSSEEIGNPVHPGTKKQLANKQIYPYDKRAIQMKKEDYDTYDYLIGMDAHNIANMQKIVGNDPKHKIYRLLDFTKHPADVADPWYTGNFERTFDDISKGCQALLEVIKQRL